MSEQKHTPEPWHLGQERVTQNRVCGYMDDGSEMVVADTNHNFDAWAADARRIVACVNGFKGFNVDFIERGEFVIVSDAAYNELEQERDQLRQRIEELEDREKRRLPVGGAVFINGKMHYIEKGREDEVCRRQFGSRFCLIEVSPA